MDRLLTRDDVVDIVDKIHEVQDQSETLGRLLKLPDGTRKGIHKQYRDPQECLMHVIDEFVSQVKPTPTWRVILKALENTLIRKHRLAEEIKTYLAEPETESTSAFCDEVTHNSTARPRKAVVPFCARKKRSAATVVTQPARNCIPLRPYSKGIAKSTRCKQTRKQRAQTSHRLRPSPKLPAQRPSSVSTPTRMPNPSPSHTQPSHIQPLSNSKFKSKLRAA